jgi:hypothetical protein
MTLDILKKVVGCPAHTDLDKFFYDFNEQMCESFFSELDKRYRRVTNGGSLSQYAEIDILKTIIEELSASDVLPGPHKVIEHAQKRLLFLHRNPKLVHD